MGGSSSSAKSSSTTDQNQTSTTTPIVPNSVSQPLNTYLSNVNTLMSGANPTQAASLVAGPTASQTAAFNSAANLSTPWDYNGAGQAAISLLGGGPTSATTAPASTSLMSASQAAPLISQFMNPYVNNVVGSTLAVANNQNQQAQAQLAAQNAGSGAFGGSRFGAAQANLLAQQGLNNNELAANLFSNGYSSALGAAQTQAAQNQAASAANQAALNSNAQFNANLAQNNNQFNAAQQAQNIGQAGSLFNTVGNNLEAAQNTNIATQLAAGQDQRSINAEQNPTLAYMSELGTLDQMLGVNPTSLFGSTSIGNATTNASGSQSSSTIGGSLSGMFGPFSFGA